VRTIFLVNARFSHAPRRALFEAQRFEVVPVAALASLSPDGRAIARTVAPFSWRDLVPNVFAFTLTSVACNEILGRLL